MAQDILNTSLVRTSSNTLHHIENLSPDYPSFTHKWSGEFRKYTYTDIALPSHLDIKGTAFNDKFPVIAFAGTRSPSVECFCLVTKIASILASQGKTLVSGGVPGVDLACHLAAFNYEESKTYAILSNPVERGLFGHEWNNIYIENLFKKRGGFISEYKSYAELFSVEQKERLLQRCRIITGLSDILLVFECSKNSATVDTAKRALLQGKKVLSIQTEKITWRNGISQLAEEHQIEILSEKNMTIDKIVEYILRP